MENLKNNEIIFAEDIKKVSPTYYKSRFDIVKVIIPPTVHSIPLSAFEGCSNLIEVDILPRTTELKIESYAFSNCSSLSKINLSSNVSFLGSQNFEDCQSLPKLGVGLSILKSVRTQLITFKENRYFLAKFGLKMFMNCIVTDFITKLSKAISLSVELPVTNLTKSEFYKLTKYLYCGESGNYFDCDHYEDAINLLNMLIYNYEKIK